MGGQHIVVSSDDADIGAIHHLDGGFVVTATRRHAVGQIAATELASMHWLGNHCVDVTPILVPQCFAAGGDRFCDANDFGVHDASVGRNM